ncbi:MAG: tetratricopeptide repeat protein, partial [Anaerolineae bacterium]|nr:tetratricopeptide repeat protein [Anaerolineae bacterium]
MADTGQPDFDRLWNYDDPGGTEQHFRDLLPAAQQSGDLDYTLQLLTQIARTQGLQRQFDSAHQTLNQVEARLATADAIVTIRYLLERGRVLNSSRQADQALPLFVQAWDAAREAGDDFYAVDAAHMAAIAESSPEQQLKWNRIALDLAERTEDARAKKWPAPLHNNLGWTYHDAGEYAQALEHFEQALAWRQQSGDVVTIRIADWCIGRCLRSLGRIEDALAKQQNLLRQHEQAATSDGYV